MIHVSNTKLLIEFEQVILLKIQSVWNSSDTFAFILPQQRPVLVSAHAQNFFSWSSEKKRRKKEEEEKNAGKNNLLSPQYSDRGV